MNKLIKGSIAGVAGITLLLGGAGTLALWNASADIDGVAVNSGTLSLSADDAVWMGSSSSMVPGDVVTYSSTLTITALGENLHAMLGVDEGSIAGDAELADALEIDTVAVGTLPAGVTSNGDGTFDVEANTGDIELDVQVTITLPDTVGDTDGDEAQTQDVNLSGLAFQLQQYLPLP